MAKLANLMSKEKRETIHTAVLNAAATLFLEEGYTKTTLKQISEKSAIQVSTINREYGGKVNILCELIYYVLQGQIRSTNRIFGGEIEDKALYYAVETTLQLYIADSLQWYNEVKATGQQNQIEP